MDSNAAGRNRKCPPSALVDPDAALHGYLDFEIGQSVLSSLKLKHARMMF
jgi:hypothetical protein